MKKVTLELRLNDNENTIFERALKKSGLKKTQVSSMELAKKSIDARHKNDIKICYTINLYQGDEPKQENLTQVENKKAIVVGSGPCGLFTTLNLLRHGEKVTLIERGEAIEDRQKSVNNFINSKKLNTESNIQFGEGGAGTYSDGKLNTGVNSKEIINVLKDFVKFGAPNDILYLSKPHIGSDKLVEVVKNIRKEIIRLGGEVHFNERVVNIITDSGKAIGVKTTNGEYYADDIVLAIGHSSRDTFENLYKQNIAMEQKEFAVGFRIEQLQEVINKDRFGEQYKNPKLIPADYKFVSHASDRAVFTFCMCPGGEVVAASSEENRLVVNGMSNFKRDGENANSAIICQVRKADFGDNSPLGGINFQRKIEGLAFSAIGGYLAPIQLAEDFINDTKSTKLLGVKPTYRLGYDFFELKKLLPTGIIESLKSGLYDINQKWDGFASKGAVLTGIESRTSSPVRILRNEKFQSLSLSNLYPAGEGCGYAGGIMSAAVDGLKVSNAIIEKYII